MSATSLRGPVRAAAMTLAAAGLVVFPGMEAAAATVPGERWQQQITAQMQDTTVPMGGGEVCAPVGKVGAELAKLNRNCRVSNARQTGNSFTADVRCTGREALEGPIEEIFDGDRMTGSMRAKSAEGDKTVLLEATRLGACQAVEPTEPAPVRKPRAASTAGSAAAARAELCRTTLADLKKNPDQTGLVAPMFMQAGGACVTRPINAEFCAALKTRAGFAGLTSVETGTPGITAASLAACNLGQGEEGVEALRARLISSAEAEGDAGFLIANAPERAAELARTQCVLKGDTWVGRAARLDRFCDSNFAEDARRSR